MAKFSRRTFIKAAGAAAATLSGSDPGIADAAAPPPHDAAPARTYAFLHADEASFIEAAVDRLIPSDDVGPGAIDAGVPNYIDRQLAGAWGAGERLYRSGPWHAGSSTQGYQLPFTPAELFRHALRGIAGDLRKTRNTTFARLAAHDQDAYLTSLENGTTDLDGVPANVFFQSLLDMTIEGFFSDPVYGGNRGMVAWKMIGFPGAYADYYELVDRHGIAFARAPISLAEDARGTVHVHPDISTYPLRKKGA